MRSVSIAIILDKYDNMLMGKRKDNDSYANPGGHCNENEDPEQACIREVKEEVNLDIESLELVKSGYKPEKDMMVYIFYVKIKDINDLDISKDPDKEFKNIEFIDPFSVINNLHVPVKNNWGLEWWANNKI